jgi:APA family basic amino acid/polyamine antiporter
LKKLRFQSVISIVIGSQIGAGIFLLPARLAVLGPFSLFGWIVSGTGAILLALVFAQLSTLVSGGGGPHVYVEKAFGRTAAFFTAWAYWLISWIGSLTIVVAAVGYLSSLIGFSSPLIVLFLEAIVISSITLINIRGTNVAGSLEVLLTILKCTPLIIIPLAAICCLKLENLYPQNSENLNILSTLNAASLMTFWGFIGLETATTTAGIIENPKKVIPRAVILGTLIVAVIYFFNSLGIMAVVPSDSLAKSQAPYVEATQTLFGSEWTIVMGIIAFVTCVGTLNAWVLTSGQIAAGAAKNKLFPSFFSKTNQWGSPYVSLLLSLSCNLLILCLTLTQNLLAQLTAFIDISVIIFVFIYLFCACAYIKIAVKDLKKSYLYKIVAILGAGFCVWILLFISLQNLLLCSLFVISGIPIYLLQRRNFIS